MWNSLTIFKNYYTILCSKFASKNLKQTFLKNKQKILSYINITLCSKLSINNFQHNSIYQHLIKTSKFLQNKESEMFLCQLGYNTIKVYIFKSAAEGQHYWKPAWVIYKYMVKHKYTDQLVTMKPLSRNEKLCWNEALCRNEYTNKFTDWYKFECWL